MAPLTPLTIETMAKEIANRWPTPSIEAKREQRAAVVARCIKERHGYRRLFLAPAEAHAPLPKVQSPGQYITVRYGALAPRFLVLANAPQNPWELLISPQSTLGQAIPEDATGQQLYISAPEGPGFNEQLWTLRRTQPLLAFATGSGIATIKALLEHIEQHSPEKLGRCVLYYGERGPADHAYNDALGLLMTKGLKVHLVHEQDSAAPFVQDAYLRQPEQRADADVILSGAPIMTERVAALMLSRGLEPARLHVNIAAAVAAPWALAPSEPL